MSVKVEDIMVRDVKTANSDDTILRAAEIMNQYEIGCIGSKCMWCSGDGAARAR